MNRLSIILLLVIVGCTSTPGILVPTARVHEIAREALSERERARLDALKGLTIDDSHAEVVPVCYEYSDARFDAYSPDLSRFVAGWNQQMATVRVATVQIKRAVALFNIISDVGRQTPTFRLTLTLVDEMGREWTIEGFARGPSYSAFRVWDIRTSAVAIESASVAFERAFLTALTKYGR